MSALYYSIPAYLPKDLVSISQPSDVDVEVAWLVPLHPNEASFVMTHGWSLFEDKLVDEDPDLLDFQRPPMTGLC
jgi:hypothetical protein